MASSSSSSPSPPPSSSGPSSPTPDTSTSATPTSTSATSTSTSDVPSSTSSSTSDVPSSTSVMASSSSSDIKTTTTSTPTSPPPTTTTTTPPPTTTTTTTSDSPPPTTTTSDTPPPTTTTSDTPPPTTTTTTTTPTPTTTTTTSSDTPPTTTTTSTTSDPPPTSSDDPTTTSTTLPSPSPSPSPRPTTTQVIPTTTLKTTVFISTTDNRGSPTSTAPPTITSTFTSRDTDGGLVTVTQVIANPSLIPNDSHTKDSGFFGNTGAVAAVFVLVGLAATSIAIWTVFAIRRRRRQSRIEYQTADAALRAATTPRPPLEDDDDPQQQHFSPLALQMSRQRSSPGMTSTTLGLRGSYNDDPDHRPDPYNPYEEFGHIPLGPVPTNASNGYSIARTSSPPNAHVNNDRSQRASAAISLASGPDGHLAGTHSTTPSGTSIEPLLASYRRQSTGSSQLPGEPVTTAVPPTAVLPRTPPIDPSQLLIDVLEPLEVQSAFTTDDRLDPKLQQRQREAESASMRDLRDDEDYTRPVLGVRNLP